MAQQKAEIREPKDIVKESTPNDVRKVMKPFIQTNHGITMITGMFQSLTDVLGEAINAHSEAVASSQACSLCLMDRLNIVMGIA